MEIVVADIGGTHARFGIAQLIDRRVVALDDIAAMARAVTAVWQGDPAAMGRRARAHVTDRFSWNQTFATLLGEVYPRAMAAAWRRQHKPRWFRPARTAQASLPEGLAPEGLATEGLGWGLSP